MKVFLRQIYSYNFHFFKLNNLKVIHDLYSQCLTQTLSKTTFFSSMEVQNDILFEYGGSTVELLI